MEAALQLSEQPTKDCFQPTSFTLKENITGEIFTGCTFEIVGACDPGTLQCLIDAVKEHQIPCGRVVSFVGLDILIENGWIAEMLDMAKDAGIRLIAPPISPFTEVIGGSVVPRWNFDSRAQRRPEISLSMGMNEETISYCRRTVREFYQSNWTIHDSLMHHFGILCTDLALVESLSGLRAVGWKLFLELSAFAGTRNWFGVRTALEAGSDCINLTPMSQGELQAIHEKCQESDFSGRFSPISVCIDPPNAFRPHGYNLSKVMRDTPFLIEAGARTLNISGGVALKDLANPEILKQAIPGQINTIRQIWGDVFSKRDYTAILEPGNVLGVN